MNTPLPLISFVIVSLNGAEALPLCLGALARLDWPADRYEVIVVNNGSTDGTRELLDSWPECPIQPIHLPRNHGFAGGNNVGIRRAKGDWVVLLNDDAELSVDWARTFAQSAAAHPEGGILGSLLLYPDGTTIQHAGGVVEANALTKHTGVGETDRGQHDSIVPCDYVTGAVFAMRRDVLLAVGLLDEGYWPIYFEEIDYCWRAWKAGFSVLMTPARAIHHESRTTVALSEGFLRKYHRNRLRYVVMNFGPRRVARWARAEYRWLRDNRKYLPWGLMIPMYAKCFLLGFGWLILRGAGIRRGGRLKGA